jgi:hypothetical protein
MVRTPRLKPALYLLRVLLTGLHLMRTGRLRTDLSVLGAALPYVPDLIAAKRSAEHAPFPAALLPSLQRDAARLRSSLDEATDASHLPSHPSPDALNSGPARLGGCDAAGDARRRAPIARLYARPRRVAAARRRFNLNRRSRRTCAPPEPANPAPPVPRRNARHPPASKSLWFGGLLDRVPASEPQRSPPAVCERSLWFGGLSIECPLPTT